MTPIEILQGDGIFINSSWDEVSENDVVKAMESYALQQSESAVREYRERLKAAIKSRNILQEEYKNELSSKESENHHNSQIIIELRKRCEDLEADREILKVNNIDLAKDCQDMRAALKEYHDWHLRAIEAKMFSPAFGAPIIATAKKLLSDEREG